MSQAQTTAQRDFIRNLMRKGEYDMRTCGAFHRGLAKAAQVPVPADGEPVDSWIAGLSRFYASRLIEQLKAEQQ